MSDPDGSSTKGDLPGDVGVPSGVLVRIHRLLRFLPPFGLMMSEVVDILEVLSWGRNRSFLLEIFPTSNRGRGLMSVIREPLPKENKRMIESELKPDTQLLNAGILYLSKAGELSVFNDIAAELLGRPESSGTVCDLDTCFTKESDEYRVFRHVITTECEYRDAVIKWEVGGTMRHVLLDTFVHQAANGEVYGMYLVMKDMGNFSTLDQQTQRIEKMDTVGKLAAGIAHEIRNPLTTVKGFLQVLEGRLQDGLMNEEIEYVQVMMSEIERVNALVAELLLLSKPQHLKRTAFSLHDLFEEIYPWLQASVRDRDLETMFSVPHDIQMAADRDMIRQLFLHLVKNAIEAMDSGGCLSVSARETADKIEFSVSDTGPGIPYYLADKIFDAFYTTKEHGTGLGLAICQRIVADHAGNIRVSSKGFGTTFTVSLPVVRDKTVPRPLQSRIYPLFS